MPTNNDGVFVPRREYYESLETRITELEDQNRFLNSCNQELSKRIQKVEMFTTHFWMQTLSDKDRKRVIQMLGDKSRKPSIKFTDDFEVEVTWDGLTLDEIDVKDVIE